MTTTPNPTIERLSQSAMFQDYERAFGEATGLPLALTSVEEMQLTHHHRRHENPFCALMAKQNKSCAACLRAQADLAIEAKAEAKTVTCFAGFCESAVPLHIGEQLIGFLRTGEIMTQNPTDRHFNRVSLQLLEMGLKVEPEKLREAYFKTRVLSEKQYASVIQLLRVFAQHLSLIANQIVFRNEHAESQQMTRAREYIANNYQDDISLSSVAGAVHMSTFYFCKQFKKATGMSFTNYLGRIRVEKAKEMLLNPHVRISEAAFECGFQSLTHFNRIFRKVAGESPSSYRERLALRQAA